jgi:hypothetical protein
MTVTSTWTTTATVTYTPVGISSATPWVTPNPPRGPGGPCLFPNPVVGKGGDSSLLLWLSSTGEVRVGVYTSAYRRIGTWEFPGRPRGENRLSLDWKDFPKGEPANGLYYLVIEGPGVSGILKVVLLR